MSELKRRTSSRKPKAKPSGPSFQRTLLDHFTPNKPQDTPVTSGTDDAVTELLTPESGIESQPHPAETSHGTAATTGGSSPKQSMPSILSDQSNSPPPVSSAAEPSPPPKRLFPLFERGFKAGARSSSLKTTKLPSGANTATTTVDTSPLLSASQPQLSIRHAHEMHAPPSSAPAASSSREIVDLTVDNNEEEGTEDTPIFIASSPVRERPPPVLRVPGLPKPLRPPPSPQKIRRMQKERAELDSPLPTADNQHIRGHQDQYLPPTIAFPRRDKGKQPARDSDAEGSSLSFLKNAWDAPTSASASTAQPTSTPAKRRGSTPELGPSTPLSREASPGTDDLLHTYWNERWRPRRASQVLGNEQSAQYLRDWMHALRLHYAKPPASSDGDPVTSSQSSHRGSQKRKSASQRKKRRAPKGPAIIREVKRPHKRRRGGLDGWMVDDDDDDVSDSFFSGSEEEEFELDPFGDKIHNTILLNGPSGSGKTAAVYACAEELGWNVFEVYPGLGKRGGTNLDALVGDVGRNHTLPPARSKASAGVGTFFARQDAPDGFSRLSIQPEDSKHAVVVDVPPGASQSDGNSPQVQSIVLLEEVDVVFGDEAGFWPAVIAFIKSCKRPVVLTCNDISLVPVSDLPLQSTLSFTPPSTALFTSLLRRRGVAGFTSSPQVYYPHDEQIRQETASSIVDLRQSINQHQIGLPISGNEAFERSLDSGGHAWLETSTEGIKLQLTSDGNQELREVRALFRNAESVSYLEAYLVLHRPFYIELSDGHPDDEVGYRTLRATARSTLLVAPEHYVHDALMARAAHASFTRVGFAGVARLPRGARAHAQQQSYRTRLEEGLGRFVPGKTMALQLPALHLEYGPWLRYMAGMDKAEREQSAARRASRAAGRATQNSQRVDAGMLGLTAEEMLALESTGLVAE
ncbi:hypothetical protein FA95DRAFT_1607807 [Auriscalpium vulgare]|uniref:Uncharacterized protein n=1 Tax=Auriscalpium vulgare TaxID=40419 RepID=A0ACB8RMM5_9AGAM|nr:hypothetical protein FA95DRAFT_1607807 [Auriscalpium vulgare]